MRVMPDGDGLAWRRHLDERARRQVAELVPRPGCPIYGLAAPRVRPVALAEAMQIDGDWTQITLGYGPWDETAGPCLRVTTAVTPDEMITPGGMQIVSATGMHGGDPAAELRQALRAEARRPAALPPVADAAEPESFPTVEAESPGLPAVVSVRLPAGPALIVRQGTIWAAPSPPPPDLGPAEGVAALRALADFVLAGQAERRAARADRDPRDPPSPPPRPADWGARYGALWRRAVLEQQRVAGADGQAADAAVTSVVNHLGHLAEKAAWFVTGRLRAAATDETLRHAMLGAAVRSAPAQRAWAAYWSRPRPVPGGPPDPDGMRALHESWLALESAWLAAWESWTREA